MDVALHRAGVTFVLDRAGHHRRGRRQPPRHVGPVAAAGRARASGSPRRATPPQLREAAARGRRRRRRPDGGALPQGRRAAPTSPAIERVGGVDVLRRAGDRDVLLVAVGAMAAHRASRSPTAWPRRASASPSSTRAGCCRSTPRWSPLAARHRLVVTVEDGVRVGGVGSAVAADAARRRRADARCATSASRCGSSTTAARAEVLDEIGLTAQEVSRRVVELVAPAGRRAGRRHPRLSSGGEATSSAVTSSGRGTPRSRSSVADHAAPTNAGSIRERSYQPRRRIGTAIARIPVPSPDARCRRRDGEASSARTSHAADRADHALDAVTAEPGGRQRAHPVHVPPQRRPPAELGHAGRERDPGVQRRHAAAVAGRVAGEPVDADAELQRAAQQPLPDPAAPEVVRMPGWQRDDAGGGAQPLAGGVAELGDERVEAQQLLDPAAGDGRHVGAVRGQPVGARGGRDLVPADGHGGGSGQDDAGVRGHDVDVRQDADRQHAASQRHVIGGGSHPVTVTAGMPVRQRVRPNRPACRVRPRGVTAGHAVARSS